MIGIVTEDQCEITSVAARTCAFSSNPFYVLNTCHVWFGRCNIFREAYYLLSECSQCIRKVSLFLLKNILYMKKVVIEQSTETHERIGRGRYLSHFFYKTSTPRAHTSAALGISQVCRHQTLRTNITTAMRQYAVYLIALVLVLGLNRRLILSSSISSRRPASGCNVPLHCPDPIYPTISAQAIVLYSGVVFVVYFYYSDMLFSGLPAFRLRSVQTSCTQVVTSLSEAVSRCHHLHRKCLVVAASLHFALSFTLFPLPAQSRTNWKYCIHENMATLPKELTPFVSVCPQNSLCYTLSTYSRVDAHGRMVAMSSSCSLGLPPLYDIGTRSRAQTTDGGFEYTWYAFVHMFS